MDQFGNELKKFIKAGMGAVASGLEKGQEAIENLAQKGEPLYQQAKSAVTDAAGKVAQAVNDGIQSIRNGPTAEEVIDALRAMGREEWDRVRAALDEFEAQADEAAKAAEEAASAAQQIMDAGEPFEEAPAEEGPKAAEEPKETDEPKE